VVKYVLTAAISKVNMFFSVYVTVQLMYI